MLAEGNEDNIFLRECTHLSVDCQDVDITVICPAGAQFEDKNILKWDQCGL